MKFSKENILTILQLPGLGRVTAFNIADYARNSNIEINSNSDFLDLFKLCVDKKIVKRFKDYSLNDIDSAFDKSDKIIDSSLKAGINYTCFYDNDFPNELKKLNKGGKNASPIILYYKGIIDNVLNIPSVAIIGTREITKEGTQAGTLVSKRFAESGFNIVSGLAIGCDTVAHKGAIDTINGKTTAFLAHGLDTVYPKENTILSQDIIEKGGVLFSEYAIGVGIRGPQLVERDRLQAGMALATIVIQTGIKGGTMHAVNTSFENNKNVYVIKYKDDELLKHDKVQGNEYLLKEKHAIPLSSKNIEEVIINLKSI